MTRVLGFVFGVAALILIGFGVISANNRNNDNYCRIMEPSEENGFIGDHVKGSSDAPVLIFEYADFQCPGCASVNKLVNAAIEALDGKVALVYRNYILSYHKNGNAAASAAESAGLQGYWKPFADLLFANQAEWENASPSERTSLFRGYFQAASNGEGDEAKFLSNLSSEDIQKKISNDAKMTSGVDFQGTPAFYIDGELIDWSVKSSVRVNGKVVSWDSGRVTAEDFTQLFKDIAAAKLGE